MSEQGNEFTNATDSIGGVKVFENERLRVWQTQLEPGERLPAHRHARPYFWTATTAGQSRSRYADGRVVESEYKTGDTRFFDLTIATGFVHDLENTGSTRLCFVTVEFSSRENPFSESQ
ncbi:MAG: hypothetical protein R3C03_06925 [Pirellulaceae bacterium]